jgi:hypothetical protein
MEQSLANKELLVDNNIQYQESEEFDYIDYEMIDF